MGCWDVGMLVQEYDGWHYANRPSRSIGVPSPPGCSIDLPRPNLNSIRFDATTLHIPYPYPTAMSAAAPVTLWLLKYDYVPDILDKRVPHRCVEWLWAIVRWPKAYRRIHLIKLPPHRAAHIASPTSGIF